MYRREGFLTWRGGSCIVQPEQKPGISSSPSSISGERLLYPQLGQWEVILQRGFGNNRYYTAMIYIINVNVMTVKKLMWLI
jgi:hypothetical protein